MQAVLVKFTSMFTKKSLSGISQLSPKDFFHALTRSKTVVFNSAKPLDYARFCPLTLSTNPLPVPAAVADEKYLGHSDFPSSYAAIRREMSRYADPTRRALALSESVKVA